ncbi:hypothetical protein INT47_007116 [Mucor saturninus]|uniref:ATP-dependent DNA helicase n=1 Tax=Mucor saturninus TaxID=64648 RepID=A0A8H7QRN6_9FUNG|nr:hypothetical protein INT47_007116 [Mucor saturninus]
MFPGGEDGWNINLELNLDDEAIQRNQERDENSLSSNRLTQKSVSLNQFYQHRLQVRPGETMTCHFGRLFHLYIVDMYCKIEGRRLYYLRTNQSTLRSELYSGLADVRAGVDMSRESIGKRVILPSSHTGSPRALHQMQQDAMAVVRALGKPDLFVTITCNPNWKEIVDELLPGEVPSERPDLICRVFDLKLKEIFTDIKDKMIFGKVKGLIHVIEYQKRGLPHAHVVIILAECSKLRTPSDIDKYISAEIPDPVRFPKAFKTITKHMMHTPCNICLTDSYGKIRMCRDNKDKTCSKHFPKDIYHATTIDEKGFAKYRRRPTTLFVLFPNGYHADNRWVVPHNLYLAVKYNTHINVEFCAGNQAIKYLFKYIYKGSDRAQIAVLPAQTIPVNITTDTTTVVSPDDDEDLDEITSWLSVRYISTVEACWRIMGKRTHSCQPSIKRLAIHLSNQQNVTFSEGASSVEIQRAMEKQTTLTAYFKLNRDDIDARSILYNDIPAHYVQDAKTHLWKKRRNQQKYPPIGRMYFISATDIERYCLRLLLLHVKGATSFDQLKTTESYDDDGVRSIGITQWPTFREAAQALNLLEDGREWDRAMTESFMLCSSSAKIRELFSVLLIFNFVPNYKEIWDNHRDNLSADFEYTYRHNLANHGIDNQGCPIDLDEQDIAFITNQTILDITSRLLKNFKDIANFPELPQPDPSTYNAYAARAQNLFDHEIGQYDVDDLAVQVIVYEGQENGCLNQEQRVIYNEIISAIYNTNIFSSTMPNANNFFFVDGPGGTGKTLLYNALLAKVRSGGEVALACASSGIAATLLPGGRTAHSLFQIPIDIDETSVCNIKLQDISAKMINDAKLIIWDEAPMMNKMTFECVSRLLQEITGNYSLPFGGKVVVLGGDFRQTLPIVQFGSRSDIVNACVTNSVLFRDCKVLRLLRNMRLTSDSILEDGTPFQDYLLGVGEGRQQIYDQYISIPASIVSYAESVQEVVDNVFGDSLSDESLYKIQEFIVSKAILAAHNTKVDEINELATEKLPGISMVYLSDDSIEETQNSASTNFPVESLNAIKPSGMPPHKLVLKRFQPIMCLRNINSSEGLCNGTRLICRNFTRNVIEAEIAVGDNAGTFVLIPRIVLISSDNANLPFTLRRRQFPVQPAFGMTINKSQGQTLSFAAICLIKPVFTHGQLYVALSRVRDPANLNVILLKEQPLSTLTDNVVFTEVLTRTQNHT